MRKLVFTNVLDKLEESVPVSAFFVNAVVPPFRSNPEGRGHGGSPSLTGLNVGIAVPHQSADEAKQFDGKMDFREFFTVHVETYEKDNLVSRVPVIVHGGNGYCPSFGSSCLFGYVSSVVGFDESPQLSR